MHVGWACEAPNTFASQAVFTTKAMCLVSHLRKDGGVKLPREILESICKKSDREFITVEREMNAITAEHLRGWI